MSYLTNYSRQTHDLVSPFPVFSAYLLPLIATLFSLAHSRLCHHSFSEAAIRDFLGPSRTLAKKCPASGCTRKICLNDLQPDKSLEKRVKAAEKRMQRHEEDSDGDEVIE